MATNATIKITRRTLIIAILVIYLFVKVLSRAISLIINVLRPISAKTPYIPVIEIPIDIIPKPATPKYRAVYMVIKNPNE